MDIAPPAVSIQPSLAPGYVSTRREFESLSGWPCLPTLTFHPEPGVVPAAAFARLERTPFVLRDWQDPSH